MKYLMKYLILIASLFVVTDIASAEPLRVIRTVPEGATIEYRINGRVEQSMNLAPGTYEITVRSLSEDGAIHGRPRRRK
jgi:hypothetical protein